MKMTRAHIVAALGICLFMTGCNPQAPSRSNTERERVSSPRTATNALQEASANRAGYLSEARQSELLSRPIPEAGTTSEKADEDYASFLTDEEFHVLRQMGTERAFTGVYWDEKREGIYHCRACNAPLFDSKTKFKSGTGWPSYYAGIDERVATKPDRSYGMNRTEIVCAHCESHLGHVFEDGPEPTGLRYCANSLSLVFNEKSE